MGASAQFARVTARFDDANLLAVLVTKEGECPHLVGLGARHLVRPHRRVGDDALVRQLFDRENLLVVQR